MSEYDVIVKTGGEVSGCEIRGAVYMEPKSTLTDCDIYPTVGRAAITIPKCTKDDLPICTGNRFHGDTEKKNTWFIDSGSVQCGGN